MLVLVSACGVSQAQLESALAHRRPCESDEDCQELEQAADKILAQCNKDLRGHEQSFDCKHETDLLFRARRARYLTKRSQLLNECSESRWPSSCREAMALANKEDDYSAAHAANVVLCRLDPKDPECKQPSEKQDSKKTASTSQTDSKLPKAAFVEPEQAPDWEKMTGNEVAKACDDYMTFDHYAIYIANRSARRELGDLHKAQMYCLVLGGILLHQDFEAWLAKPDTVAAPEEINRRAVRDALKDNDYQARKIAREIKKSVDDKNLPFLLPPGTTAQLQKVGDALPGFVARAKEQEKTMQFVEDVNAVQKACMRKCILTGQGGSFQACERICGRVL
jgi:hypothetical protein